VTLRIPLPMAPTPASGLVNCTECGRCCTYVSVGINEPRSLRFASDILWYLYHENISVYRDGDAEWSVVFETRCRHLQGDLLCHVYPDRPIICRDFDNLTCEVNSPEGGLTLSTPEEFLVWLRDTRPVLFHRLCERYVPADLRDRVVAALPPAARPSARGRS
jgi:Fe-S-cluster containining protein